MSNEPRAALPRFSTRQKQLALFVGLGLLAFLIYLSVVSMLGGPEITPKAAQQDLNSKARSISVPGSELDSKSSWLGGAGKDVAAMKAQSAAQDRLNSELQASLKDITEKLGRIEAERSKVTAQASDTNSVAPSSAGAARAQSTPAPLNVPVLAPNPATSDPNAPWNRLPRTGSAQMPPGTPNDVARTLSESNVEPAPPALMRVSLRDEPALPASQSGVPKGPASGSDGSDTSVSPSKALATTIEPPKNLDNYLPIGFVKAVLLGGIDAPTGGQAQSNPLPVLLQLTDLAQLPNRFRANIKECFVIGEAYGDLSSERGYIRTTTLSCINNNKQTIEVPLNGSVFDETGKVGMRGRVVSKQGTVLANALLAGIASGIGQGFQNKYTTTSVSPLGSTQSVQSDKALEAGVGAGVGRALDRLANYYISVAEKMFPIVEIDSGRVVDVVIKKGVHLDAPLPTTSGYAIPASDRRMGRPAVMSTNDEDEE
jgi:conjugal transfer pilus assembly protein TraB